MRAGIFPQKYASSDPKFLPSSEQSYMYPINSFLSQTVKSDDELKVILIIKKDGQDFWKNNVEIFKNEMNKIVEDTGAKVEYSPYIESDFNQEKATHERLIKDLVEQIDLNSHIMVDITYGSKDLPIIMFTVLNFAEKFLKCEVDNMLYGQASFDKNNKVIPDSMKLCDMIPLYYLNSVVDIIQCDDPAKAKEMLMSLLTLKE